MTHHHSRHEPNRFSGVLLLPVADALIVALWALGIGMFVATEFRLKATEVVRIAVAAAALTMMGRALTRIETPDLRAGT